MKVWIVNPFDNLSAEGYRPQRYELLARALAADGHEVRYWTGDFSHASKAKRRLQDDFFSSGFRLMVLPTLPYRDNVSFGRVRSHREFAAEFRRQAEAEVAKSGAPQVLVTSLPPLALAGAAFELREKYGITVVVDVQDLWPHAFSQLLPRGFRWLGRLLFAGGYAKFRAAIRGADLVTGTADSYRAEVMSAGARGYARYYLGFPMDAGAPTGPRNGSLRRLAYVGGLGKTYDLVTAIRALAALPGYRLDVFGSGGREAELRLLAVRCGVGNRVCWHGYVRDDGLRKELVRCVAGIVPMSVESRVALPNKLGDYVNAGLPVVSSLAGESFELLARHGAVARYAPGSVAGFAAAVKALDALTPDFEALRRELDAGGIYRAFAHTVINQSVARSRWNGGGRTIARTDGE